MSLGKSQEIRTGNLYVDVQFINAKSLVGLFFQSHQVRGLTPNRKYNSYLREAKNLIGLAGKQGAVELIFKAHQITKTSYGFQFLRRLYGEER